MKSDLALQSFKYARTIILCPLNEPQTSRVNPPVHKCRRLR